MKRKLRNESVNNKSIEVVSKENNVDEKLMRSETTDDYKLKLLECSVLVEDIMKDNIWKIKELEKETFRLDETVQQLTHKLKEMKKSNEFKEQKIHELERFIKECKEIFRKNSEFYKKICYFDGINV